MSRLESRGAAASGCAVVPVVALVDEGPDAAAELDGALHPGRRTMQAQAPQPGSQDPFIALPFSKRDIESKAVKAPVPCRATCYLTI